ncbi:hypothetical protein [Curtobacterium flaccumfaciens]|uniref:hypothetical protein n=1 Tax=Curtobacterium flaccumfaciens TaxID=2035 RepID=UPI003D9A1BBE
MTNYETWTQDRTLNSYATNHGSRPIAYQGWQKFKEAFSPEVVERAISANPVPARHIYDPFGGSGTTALTAQFLGVKPITGEVNPYLADVIRAKLQHYDIRKLEVDAMSFLSQCETILEPENERSLPATFIEPGVKTRWLFAKSTGDFLLACVELARGFTDEHARLFKVAIGGTLVDLSNARVSGKGRRYRSNWKARESTISDALNSVQAALRRIIEEIRSHNDRQESSSIVLEGSVLDTIKAVESFDLAVLSPPYPNSFDYTDVYNIELWMLGYLNNYEENRRLREATLTSHVQIHRDYRIAPSSAILEQTLERIEERTEKLWNQNIPSMLGAYFEEMRLVLAGIYSPLTAGGDVWLVVGDSSYAGVRVEVGRILAEIANSLDFEVVESQVLRRMTAAPQQADNLGLAESLLRLRK